MAWAWLQFPLFAAASAARVARPETTVLQSCCPLGSPQLLKLLAAPGKFPAFAAAMHASHAAPPPPLAGGDPVVLEAGAEVVEVEVDDFGVSGGFEVVDWEVGFVGWVGVAESAGVDVSTVGAVSVGGTSDVIVALGPPCVVAVASASGSMGGPSSSGLSVLKATTAIAISKTAPTAPSPITKPFPPPEGSGRAGGETT